MQHPFTAPSLALASLSLLGTASFAQVRAEPRELPNDSPLVGTWIPDFEFQERAGETRRLSDVMGAKGLVLVVRDPECPVAKRYAPRLAGLAERLPREGFGVLFVNPLDAESAQLDVETFGLAGPYAVDADERLVSALAATTTTEVFLLDAARTLVYRGMLDDQYGIGFNKAAPERPYLEQALAAVAQGERPRVAATEAQGCKLALDSTAPVEQAGPTFHRDISRLLQGRCQACHHNGAVAPFALVEYDEVVKKKGMLRYTVREGLMPPWFASEETGHWRNDTSLTASEKAMLLAWIENGAPEGDPTEAPLPMQWTKGWTIGEPDYVVPMPEAITVPAEGVVDYQYVYAKTDFAEDRWVQALEILPGAPSVVHHVLVFVESPEVVQAARRGDRSARRLLQEGSEGYFACTVPGQTGLVFPDGMAKRLPAGAWLKFQLHYTPSGVEVADRSRIGLVFADTPVHTEVRTNSAIDEDLAIPPGAFDHEVQATYRFREEARLLSLFPHTHLRGNRFQYELLYPDGREELLLEVPFYDFNWQLNYEFQEPLVVPAGTRLRATAWYDNSEENPANPAPDEWVYFGEQTDDEMMIGYVNWVPAAGGLIEQD